MKLFWTEKQRTEEAERLRKEFDERFREVYVELNKPLYGYDDFQRPWRR
jgi:hypothetical protein